MNGQALVIYELWISEAADELLYCIANIFFLFKRTLMPPSYKDISGSQSPTINNISLVE